MMDERARLVESLFAEAMGLAPAEREGFLRSRCGGDGGLMSELRVLLEAAGRGPGILDGHAPGLLGVAAEDPGLLPTGSRIGPYTIRSVLGVGGMGVVYVGEQLRPQRTVALKVIRPGFATPTMLRRFEFEAEVLGRLQHPGIAQIIEAGAAETPFGVQPFFAMELVDGRPLTEHAKALTRRERVALMLLVCDAVEHAHQRGVVHRDLKPANIVVTADGRPKVLDFGVARAAGGREGEQRLTLMRTGERQLVGTLAYMSPEQVAGDPAHIDTRSDVYALGVILFELLSGEPPHDLAPLAFPDAVRAVRDDDPRPLGSLDPSCRGDLEIICAKALERSPGDRYPSAASLAEDLKRYLADQAIDARPRSAVYHLRKFTRRHRGLVAGLVVAAGAVVAGAVFGGVQYSHAVAARRDAENRAVEADLGRRAAAAERDAKMRESENLRRTLGFIQDNVLTQAYTRDGDLGRAVSIVDALMLSEPAMTSGLAADPLSEARLRYYAALIFQANNEFDAALRCAARASDLFAGLPAPPADERREADVLRTGLLARTGRFADADALAAAVLARPEAEGAGNAIAMAAFARAERGDFAVAEPLMRRQFEMALQSPNTTPLNTYVQTRRLAGLLIAMDRIPEAAAIWDERIAACAAWFGEPHAATVSFIGAAAEQLEAAGEGARAEPYRRRAARALAPDAWIARPYDAPIRLTANLRGRPESRGEAVDLARAAFDLAAAQAAPRSPILHQAAAELIRCLSAAGRTAEATAFAQESLGRFHSETGEWRYRDSEVRQAAAEAFLAAGDAARAAQLARAELDRRVRLRGWASPAAWDPLRTLTGALAASGRASEAASLAGQALTEQLESSSMQSSATLAIAPVLVEAVLSAGDGPGARGLAERVLGAETGEWPRKAVLDLRVLSAKALAAAGHRAEAAAELAAVAGRTRDALGADHPWSRRLAAEAAGLAGTTPSTAPAASR